ncbi:MAG TPA: RNA polymerase factor sigma-32 [Kofleriaceae bacterium]|jgi:RNA polymerase sigma-32 factor|nr:RNA polymerase factor sigma-32 [Kofleriaceae bacterium]
MAERKSRGSGAGSEAAASGPTAPRTGAKRRRKPAAKVIDVGEGAPPDAAEPAAARAPGRKRAEAAERGSRGDRERDGAHEADGAHESEATEADTEAETEPEADEAHGADTDMAAAGAAAIEPDEVLDDSEAAPAESRGGSLARRDPMAVYLREARRYPLLTPDEERALATRLVEHGDSQAARKLIEANLRLVVKIAYEYRRAHKNLLDLVQEGNIGLIQAVSKFDPYRGVKLSSYAAFWIRAYILKFILNNWRLVKIGTTQAQRKLFFNLRKEREKLEQLGFQPTTALLAEKLDVPEKEVVEMERRLAAPEASLDAPIGSSGDDDGSRTRLDYLPSDDVRPDRAVAQSEFSDLLRGKLEQFAKTLEGREQTIFRERWLTEEPLTLQEIGDRYQVSRERARQLEKRMLDRLKKYLEAELGTSVDIGALSRE